MDYHQPYGAGTGASYVNGNPSTGTQGSIPPAEAIEYDQREIVNFITDSNLTPSNSDLHQLSKSVQSGKVFYAPDTGIKNQVAATLVPAPNALTAGMCFLVKIAVTNDGPAIFTPNALGNHPIVHFDGTPLNPYDLTAGAIAALAFDGTNFQLAWSQRPGGSAIYLPAAMDYYVNEATGSDANSGLTSGTAFATLQKAANTIAKFNLNGFNITVHVADATYTAGIVLPNVAGSGNVNWVGNSATPANCLISTTNRSTVIGSNCGGAHTFNGFKAAAGGAIAGDEICGFNMQGAGSAIVLTNINYGVCVGGHVIAKLGANVLLAGTQTISGGCAGNSLALGSHIFATLGGMIFASGTAPPSLTISAAITLAGLFISATFVGVTAVSYSSITNPGNVTGYKYNAASNGVINAYGAGINYYPGTIAGGTATGGQYV